MNNIRVWTVCGMTMTGQTRSSEENSFAVQLHHHNSHTGNSGIELEPSR